MRLILLADHTTLNVEEVGNTFIHRNNTMYNVIMTDKVGGEYVVSNSFTTKRMAADCLAGLLAKINDPSGPDLIVAPTRCELKAVKTNE